MGNYELASIPINWERHELLLENLSTSAGAVRRVDVNVGHVLRICTSCPQW